MSRAYTDIQMLRNLLPENVHSPECQALLNVISWMYENATGSVYDELHDAISSAYIELYEL